MVGGREVLAEVVCTVFVAWFPVDDEVTLGYTSI
jgi:hypothetical protein